MTRPLVAFVHAAPAAVEPANAALCEGFPEATAWNLLDDRLVSEADAAGGLTPALRRRMLGLIRHAVDGGADAVQLSCSMYGPVAELARQLWSAPVRGADDAAFAELARRGRCTAVLVASLDSALAESAGRLDIAAPEARILPAPAAPVSGNSLAAAVRPHLPAADLVLLAQYSLSPHAAALAADLGTEVLSPPLLAARSLRTQLLGAA